MGGGHEILSEQTKAFWLGLFIVAAFVCTAWFLLFLRPWVGDNQTTLKVRFSSIDRVAKGTTVTFAGKPVGQVSAITLLPDARCVPSPDGALYFYELTLQVDSSIHLYSYDEITLSTYGLLGEKTIALIPKIAPQGGPEAQEITTQTLYGCSTTKIEEMMEQVITVSKTIDHSLCKVSHFLEKHGEEFASTLHSLEHLTTRLNESGAIDTFSTTMTRFNTLFDEPMVKHFQQTFLQLDTLTGTLSAGQGSFGQLLYDEGFYYRFNETLCRFEKLLDTLNNYGIFYQFDGCWQREKKRERMQRIKH